MGKTRASCLRSTGAFGAVAASVLASIGCASSMPAPVAGPTEHRAALVFDTPQVRSAAAAQGHRFDQQAAEYSRRDDSLGARPSRGAAYDDARSRENPSPRILWRVPAGRRGLIISR